MVIIIFREILTSKDSKHVFDSWQDAFEFQRANTDQKMVAIRIKVDKEYVYERI